jgi:hypothetical protein
MAQLKQTEKTQLDATATVLASRRTNTRVKFDPILDLDLTIEAAGRPPYGLTVRQPVSQLHIAKVQPGSRLLAKIDPANPSVIWLDLDNS